MAGLDPKLVGQTINVVGRLSPTFSAKVALYLFARPRKGKLALDQQQYLESAIKETLYFNNIPIMTYNWPNEGKRILLVHGWESNSLRWQNLVRQLRDSAFNVIALDAPAHGLSGSKFFNAILYSEFINVVVNKFEPEVIIGHSVGGMASVFFNHHYGSESLEKLILLGAPANFTGVLDRYVELMGYNTTVEKAMERLIVKRFGKPPEYFSTALLASDFNEQALIVHDETDLVIPFEDAELINTHYPKSKLIKTNGLGHSLRDDSVNDMILGFINN